MKSIVRRLYTEEEADRRRKRACPPPEARTIGTMQPMNRELFTVLQDPCSK